MIVLNQEDIMKRILMAIVAGAMLAGWSRCMRKTILSGRQARMAAGRILHDAEIKYSLVRAGITSIRTYERLIACPKER